VRYKTSPYKAALYIFLYRSGEEGLTKGIEELELANVVDIHTYQVLDLVAVRLL
jgi:hypothetical protein